MTATPKSTTGSVDYIKDVRRNRETRDWDAYVTIVATDEKIYLGSRERSWDAERLCDDYVYNQLNYPPIVSPVLTPEERLYLFRFIDAVTTARLSRSEPEKTPYSDPELPIGPILIEVGADNFVDLTQVTEFEDCPDRKSMFLITAAPTLTGKGPYVVEATGDARRYALAYARSRAARVIDVLEDLCDTHTPELLEVVA